MKNLITFAIFMLFPWQIVAQTDKPIAIQTEASEVTVFIEGAQVLRKKTINIPAGKSTLQFTDLSPYIDANSIQVKLTGQAMVLGVNFKVSTAKALKRNLSEDKKAELEKQYDANNEKLLQARVDLELVNDEIVFLSENRQIGGANNGVTLIALRETVAYYSERMKSLKSNVLRLNKLIDELEYNKLLIQKEMSQQPESTSKPTPKGEVLVEVETKLAVQANVEISYYVKNAGWYPSYDIRATSIDKPITLLYKANVQQNSSENWKNVKLRISSANPKLGNIVPRLQTYRLDYYVAPPRYDVNMEANEIKGVVKDASGETLIGVAISFKGTTVGTVTDINGQFTLSIPYNAKEINLSYIGYMAKTLPISRSFMNITLQESTQMLDEVIVLGYGKKKSTTYTGSTSTARNNEIAQKPAPRTDLAMPSQTVENQMSVDFDIKIPYTIASGNKNIVIEVDRYLLPAEYEYYAIPKVNKSAFLLANISDWEQYNLLEGEANIFFENTYIGKTILDTRNVSDTLNISLGRDKSIVISRDKEKDTTSKVKFLGAKREVSREWKISVRNTKSQEIDFTLLDQVPVSLNNEIEVNVENTSDGVLDENTGEVKWKLKIKPSNKKELKLKYKVKYPKDKVLNVE